MSSSNSTEMEDQITMVFLSAMDEAMSIVQVEEAVATSASSSTQRPKLHRRYVNHHLAQHDH
jgi:SpoVK/Ycf46/Vps4 family AAA+-type ATPase